jgi:membrane-associated protein
MEWVTFLIDFILHVDRYLEAFTRDYGTWVYALLFAIVFVETGVVVMPFLPGDSLLFIVGTLCGAALLSLPLAMALLLVAWEKRKTAAAPVLIWMRLEQENETRQQEQK